MEKMTSQEEQEYERAIATIASLLVEYAALGNRPIPRSSIYLACGMNLDYANRLEHIMVKAGWIITTSETVKLTPLGIQTAHKLGQVL